MVALDEISLTLRGQCGLVNVEASAAHYEGETLARALIVTTLDGGPFVSYVFTRPIFQCRGHAGSLIGRAAKVLADQGLRELDLVVTVGGPGQSLYEHLGFLDVVRVP